MATYGEWGKALYENLFPSGEGSSPVYLQLDDERLAEIAAVSNLPLFVEGAADDLTTAVRGRCIQGGRLDFAGLITSSVAEAPLQIPLLGLCVLAASRMESEGGGSDFIASTNYYARLNELLAFDGMGSPPGWSNYLFELAWLDLKKRLERDERGSLEINAGPKTRRYVWYPISQSLLSRHDRQKLRILFLAERLPIYHDRDKPLPRFGEMLVEWSASARSSLSARAKAVLRIPSRRRDEFIAQARQELAWWDGAPSETRARRDVSHVSHARIDFRLELSETGEHFLALAIRRPSSFPAAIQLEPSLLGALELKSPDTDSRYFDPVEVPANYDLGQPILISGSAEGRSFRFTCDRRQVVVFHRDQHLFNAWVSVCRIEHRRPARIACHSSVRDQVVALLVHLTTLSEDRLRAHEQRLSARWHLFTDIASVNSDIEVQDSTCSCLVPDTSIRLSLDGGLQLSRPGRRSVYMYGHPPNVSTTDISRPDLLILDGSSVKNAGQLERTLLPGLHQISHGSRHISFTIEAPRVSEKPSRASLIDCRSPKWAHTIPTLGHVAGAIVNCECVDGAFWGDVHVREALAQPGPNLSSSSPVTRTFHDAQLKSFRVRSSILRD
jgi:hypothetical protein